jgi:octaprenyl-diphosphate synthase
MYKESFSNDVNLLIKVSNYIFKNSGKKIRPILIFLVSGLIGKINAKTYTAAVLIELLHVATLIHDDVVDEAHFRRRKFSINSLWKNKIAVLTGDYFLAQGLKFALKDNNEKMLLYTSKAVQKMTKGEILQLEKTRKLTLLEDEYYKIIEYKTASLFGCCCELASFSNNLPEKEMDKLYNFGIKLGLMFQIKDDLLDYENKNFTGKSLGNDIKESKMNLPLLYTIQNSTKKQKKQIINVLYQSIKKKEDISMIISLVHKNNGIIYAQKILQKYKNDALLMLDDFDDSKYKTAIVHLLDFIIERKK